MAKIILGSTCYDAWLKASNHLLTYGEVHNLIIELDNPCDFVGISAWLRDHCPSNVTGNKDHQLNNIINTIFPYKLAAHYNNRADFYDAYKRIYNRSRLLRNQKWGTYFYRMINFPYPDRNIVGENQLENAINALNGGSRARNYITLHFTCVNIESNVRPIGAPCLQFAEVIKGENNTLNLVAIYRNHDYFYKAFGNFIGLSYLLFYICTETGKQPGNLIIHSTHAYLETSKRNLRNIL